MAKSRQHRTPAETASSEGAFQHAALFEFSKVINSSLDLKFILSHVLLTIMAKVLSTRGMALLAHERGLYGVEMVKGFPAEAVGETVGIKRLSASLFDIGDLSPGRYPWVKFFREKEVALLLPMFILDRPIGVLAFGERLSKKRLEKQEVTYLRSLANIAATAIEKCHTIEELQVVNRKLDRKVQELNTLFELGKEFGVVLETDKLVRLLVFSLLGQIGVSRYLICLTDGVDVRVVASRIEGPVPQGELLKKLTRVSVPTLVSALTAQGVQDTREVLTRMGMSVIVPMLVQGDTKGMILLGEKLSREPFHQADLEFLASLANLAIISLENARLFKEAIEKQRLEDELKIAREIQKGLLPSELPSIRGIDLAASNISSKQVGGDYYDVIPLPAERYVIAIGDVSGKGTPAALLMANIQATIRALVPLNLPLAELTSRVNDLMCENTGGSKFVTFFWGVIDATARTLTYVNAGHNYPYLIRRDGSVERLDRGGMILGVLRGVAVYEQGTVRFPGGDLLLLFTDGVSEAMDPAQREYTEGRLESVLEAHKEESAQAIIEAIHGDILSHIAGAPQSDDITMMVLKVA